MSKQIVKTKPKAKVAKEYFNITTPIGLLCYPYLHKIDEGRTESSNKHSIEILVKKDVWIKEGQQCRETVLKVGRAYFKDDTLELDDFKGPFTDMDETKDPKDHEKGCIRIRAKATPDHKPTVIGPRRNEDGKYTPWTDEEVAKIKGGDYGRLVSAGVYGYPQQGGGVALGLNFFQFAKEGKAINPGKLKAIQDLEEIEVELDSPEDMVDTEPSDDQFA